MSEFVSTQFEDQVRVVLAVPAADERFVENLGRRLQAAAVRPIRRQPLFGVMRPARLVALTVVVLALVTLLALGPQRVLAQVLDWLGGYIPGVGFVQTEGGLRVLEQPVSLERDGLTMTVKQGLIDDQETLLTVLFEGIRPEQQPTNEADPGCFGQPVLVLPDGSQRLANGAGGGSGGHTWWQMEATFDPLPADVNQAQLRISCVPGTLEGSAPEDWRVDLNFIPAPDDFEVLPVVPLPTEPPQTTPQAENDENKLAMSVYVDQMVDMGDGYLFHAAISWADTPYDYVTINPFELVLRDANGNEVPYQLEFEDGKPVAGDREERVSLRTQTKQLASPLTLSLPQVQLFQPLEEDQRESMAIDLGASPSVDQTWAIDQSYAYLNGSVHLVDAQLVSLAADGQYALHLNMQLDTTQVASVILTDLDNNSRINFGGGGGGSDGLVTQAIGYGALPSGVHRIQLVSVDLVEEGPWQTTITLPETGAMDTETQTPQACLTADVYSTLATNSGAAGGKVLSQVFQPDALLPDLVITDLATGAAQTVDIGSWGALSPDGRYLTYAHEGLQIADLQTGETRTLISEDSSYAMNWSPDGSRLAFIRGGQGLYLIHADGSGLQPAPGNSADMIGVAGWLPDGAHVVVSTISPDGSQIQTMDVTSGAVTDNLLIDNRKGGFALLSPDGRRIAFSSSGFGGAGYSIYVADLGGGNQRLVAQPDDTMIFDAAAWSDDSQHLLLSVLQIEGTEWLAPVLVDVDSCQAGLLPGVSGDITGWAP